MSPACMINFCIRNSGDHVEMFGDESFVLLSYKPIYKDSCAFVHFFAAAFHLIVHLSEHMDGCICVHKDIITS